MLLKRALFAMLLVFGIMVGSIATTSAAGAPAAAPAPIAFQDDDDDATEEAEDTDDATEEATDDADTDDSDSDDVDDSDDVNDDEDSGAQGGSGDAVTVVNERGDPILEITVNEVIVEWEDFSEYSSPDRGYFFVALNITVTNISDDEQEVTDFDFMLRDEFGFLYGTSFASVDEESESADIGAFEGDEIDAGDAITGLVIFAVPDDVELVDVFYAPYGRLITVATLS